MTKGPSNTFHSLCHHIRQIGLLASVEELLGWDERTTMPAAGAEHRAEQMTVLSGIIHARWLDPRVADWLGELIESPLPDDATSDTGATIREIARQHKRRTCLPQTLVEELTRTAVLGQNAWQEARANDDYAHFRPWLEKLVGLKQQEADAVGYDACRYDALLDEYEPGQRTAETSQLLVRLRDELVPLIQAIRESPCRPDSSILTREFPVDTQEAFGRGAASMIGFDFAQGRLDVTTHPFCCSPGPSDVRITTRYNPRFFNEAFFGILHEAGHGIYEQGLPADQHGLPLGEAASLGLHESQSRMWENLVGRSRAFWEYAYPEAQKRFPGALGDVTLDTFFFAINAVTPSLIRVEADEATYNLHVLIRFELEQALIDGDLQVAELPTAWKAKYRDYLGIEPSNDAEGVLQDIHWSGGAIGYFPTYSLGNLMAAQLFETADRDLGGLARLSHHNSEVGFPRESGFGKGCLSRFGFQPWRATRWPGSEMDRPAEGVIFGTPTCWRSSSISRTFLIRGAITTRSIG